MRALAGAAGGFLLAVLWFDLMFDVQVRSIRDVDRDAARLDSICAYYARVTTAARPMNRLVALMMLVLLGSLIALIAGSELGAIRSVAALVVAMAAIGLAGARTVRNAVRLGTACDSNAMRCTLARGILRDHVACFIGIAVVLALVLAPS